MKEELLAEWKSLRSRGEIKRMAKQIEADETQKQLLISVLQERGLLEDKELSVKKMLRLFLDRSEQAQIRTNPIHRNEDFICVHCERDVKKSPRKIRDHCPFCLRGVHLDIVPGDRASKCQGKLIPAAFVLDHGTVIIQYICQKCHHQYQVKAHPDDNIPRSLSIADLS